MTVDPADVRRQLGHVRWIGGGSGAGKSTVARRIAAEYGLRLWSTDDAMADHARRCSSDDAPLLAHFVAMSMDERWVRRSPEVMLETFPWFQGEGFDLIVEDLLRLPREPGILVEGFRLLPRLVQRVAVAGQAVWLLPTPAFRSAAVEARGSGWGFLEQTSDPATARRNLLERDRLFTDRLREEAIGASSAVLDVDTSTTPDELVERVSVALDLARA